MSAGLALKNGFDGIYFIGIHYAGWDHQKDGYDDKTIHQPSHYVQLFEKNKKNRLSGMIQRNILKGHRPLIYDYGRLAEHYDFSLFDSNDLIPTIIPNWDNSPRSAKRGWVFHNSTPRAFGAHFERALQFVMKRDDPKPKVLFIKSWNEWAEGNYLEPDHRYGLQYLQEIKRVIEENKINSNY